LIQEYSQELQSPWTKFRESSPLLKMHFYTPNTIKNTINIVGQEAFDKRVFDTKDVEAKLKQSN